MSIKGMALPKGGNKLPLLLGVCFGLMAAVGTIVLLSGSSDKSSGSIKPGADFEVAVATQDIAPGVEITDGMIEIKPVPEIDKLLNVLTTKEAVVGQVATVPIIRGEQIVASKVSGEASVLATFGENPPPALILPKGLRGVSIEVSSLIGAGGLIRPGDRVDIIMSLKTSGGEDGSRTNQVAATFLQNVLVLAIDQSVTTSQAGVADADVAKEANETATTLTLAVTPSQGEILAVADTCRLNFDGRLAISLRPFGDDSILGGRPEYSGAEPPNCASLMGITGPPTGPDIFQ